MATQALFRDDAYLRECDAVVTRITEGGVELDRTVFYPLGGGQAGDTGFLTTVDGAQLRVIDARKVKRDEATPDDVLHVIDPSADWQAQLGVGATVRAQIDWERRYRHMRFHTATHLLCAVVKQLVDGCSITSDYARLDFAMTDPLDKLQVQEKLDSLIAAARPVVCKWISDDELHANPQLVKSMSVTPPLGFGGVRLLHVEDVDLQPCGGTHVRNTSEIGSIRVAKIEKKSARTRRVVLEFA
ncbi:MAG: alanyl-tRNA editing protein [Burkholderiaceae bacterium]|nr:alanyl-tRNA editing protein [Burkholderiaceae bacterium]